MSFFLGDTVGSNSAPSRSRPGPWKNATGARCDTRRPGPKGHGGAGRVGEPHGDRPQTQSFGHSGGHTGREGGTKAAFCGEDSCLFLLKRPVNFAKMWWLLLFFCCGLFNTGDTSVIQAL